MHKVINTRTARNTHYREGGDCSHCCARGVMSGECAGMRATVEAFRNKDKGAGPDLRGL